MIKKAFVASACLSIFTIGHVSAHTTILGKFSEADGIYTASEPDGLTAVNDFSIPHGCNGEPVVASVMLFPNSGDFVAEDQDGNAVSAADVYAALEDKNNLVMGPKPARDANWKRQEVLTGSVPVFNNHGDKDTDVRAFVYEGGNIGNEFLSLSRWRAKFAKIKDDSCVEAIEVRIPIVNYCAHNGSDARMDAWIGRPTAVFNDDNGEVLSDGFWPRMTIKNTGYTGDDAFGVECATALTYKVSPSNADIDTYMPLQSFNP